MLPLLPLGDISIQNRNGTTKTVHLACSTTLQNVIDRINQAGASVTAGLNSSGNGIQIEDTTGGSGNPSGFTFVKGDYTMGSGSSSGLLIITGELTTHGDTNFSGLVLVLGAGAINRDGGGGGAFYGATFVANVDWPAQSPALTSFGAPFFNFNGAGNATMQYDSSAVENAFSLLPAPVLGVCEY